MRTTLLTTNAQSTTRAQSPQRRMTNSLSRAILSLGGIPERTREQIEAEKKLLKLCASNGLDYYNARNNIYDIEKKYSENDDCYSYYESNQPTNSLVYMMPSKHLDPRKIPTEKDRQRYMASIQAMTEIERNNSALFAQTGLPETVDYSKLPTTKAPLDILF